MNIAGSLRVDSDRGWCRIVPSGVFVGGGATAKRATGGEEGSTDVETLANFGASRTWTGETSYQGSDIAHNNMSPYLTMYSYIYVRKNRLKKIKLLIKIMVNDHNFFVSHH